MEAQSGEHRAPGRGGSAFLLAQIGAHAAARFTERIAELDLTPPQTGLLRAIAQGQGRSQQELAEQLGTKATRLVALVDCLEARGAVERRRNPKDRRLYAVYLTQAGQQLLADIGQLARRHDEAMLTALDDDDRATLLGLLRRLADDHGLTPGVHPGYRRLSKAEADGPSHTD